MPVEDENEGAVVHVYENQEDEESEVNIDDDEDTVPSQVSNDDELLAIEGGKMMNSYKLKMVMMTAMMTGLNPA